MNANEMNLKQKIVHEIQRFLTYALFLTLFFCSLTTYQRLILGEYSISYFHYGYGVLEALILSKIILLGEALGLGRKLEAKPLSIVTLYKTTLFSFLVLIFTVIEHFIFGFLHGKDFAHIYEEFMSKGIDLVLAKVLVVFFVFILFFGFVETGRALGGNTLMNLFFFRKNKD